MIAKYTCNYLRTGHILGEQKINIWQFLQKQEENGVVKKFIKFLIVTGGALFVIGASFGSYVFYLVDIGKSPLWIENIRAYFHDQGINCPKCLLLEFLSQILPWILLLVCLILVLLYLYRFKYLIETLTIVLNRLDKETQYKINRFSFYGFIASLFLSCLGVVFSLFGLKIWALILLTLLFGLFFKFFEKEEGHIPGRNEILFVGKYILWSLIPAYLLFVGYTSFYPL